MLTEVNNKCLLIGLELLTTPWSVKGVSLFWTITPMFHGGFL